MYKYYGGDRTTTMTIPLLPLLRLNIYILYDHYFIYIYKRIVHVDVGDKSIHTHTIAYERRPLLYIGVYRVQLHNTVIVPVYGI